MNLFFRLGLLFLILISGPNLFAGNYATHMPCSQTHEDDAWPLSSLDYLGIGFNGDQDQIECILNAMNDNIAGVFCNGSNRLVNVGNPQYHGHLTEAQKSLLAAAEARTGVKAGLSTNPLGLYYCISAFNGENPRKGTLCTTTAMRESSNWPQRAQLVFDWRGRVRSGGRESLSDGDCYCKLASAPDSAYQLCVDMEHAPGNKCTGENLTVSPNYPDGSQCRCTVDDTDYPIENLDYCGAIVVTARRISADESSSGDTQEPTVGQSIPPAPTEPSPALKACVDDWVNRSNSCKTLAAEANASCGASSADATRAQIATINQNAANIGSTASAQDTCFRASTTATAAQSAVNDMQGSCSVDNGACLSQCAEGKFAAFEAACRPLIGRGTGAQLSNLSSSQNSQNSVVAQRPLNTSTTTGATPAATGASITRSNMVAAAIANNQIIQTNLDTEYYNQRTSGIQQGFTDGRNLCTDQNTKSRSALQQFAEGLANSLTSATQCMCRLSSSVTSCDSIPTATTCATNPSAAGCAIYGAISVCSIGENYDAKLCECQTNPKAEGCPSGSASGGLVGFASSNAIKSAMADAAAQGYTNSSSSVAKATATDLNLGSNDSGVSISGDVTANNKGAPNFNALGSGGSAGTLGSGGSAENASGDAAAASGDGLLNSIFSQAKMVGKALGFGKGSSNGDLDKAKTKMQLDPNKYRPNRKLANDDSIGSKNMDIWKMMNNCVQGESCASNINSFMPSSP